MAALGVERGATQQAQTPEGSRTRSSDQQREPQRERSEEGSGGMMGR
jgi:hypothetical protein